MSADSSRIAGLLDFIAIFGVPRRCGTNPRVRIGGEEDLQTQMAKAGVLLNEVAEFRKHFHSARNGNPFHQIVIERQQAGNSATVLRGPVFKQFE